jgi:hypothetical protein
VQKKKWWDQKDLHLFFVAKQAVQQKKRRSKEGGIRENEVGD